MLINGVYFKGEPFHQTPNGMELTGLSERITQTACPLELKMNPWESFKKQTSAT